MTLSLLLATLSLSFSLISKGTFKVCKVRLLQQARKAMFYVLCLPTDIILQLFDAMTSPI